MKKALRIMQEMQAFLAERGIDSHVTTTACPNVSTHSCEITVFTAEAKVFANVRWRSYAREDFEADWAEFEKKVKDEFFAWWE